MSNFSQHAVQTAQKFFESSSTQNHPLGELAVMNDGRKFRYVKNGAVATVAGALYQAPVIVANHQNMTTATTAIGATKITVTTGATVLTANQYQGGFLVINAGTGAGYAYKIASHPAADAGGAAVVITLEDPLLVATAVGDSKSCLISSPYNGIIAAVDTAKPVGIANHIIPASYYGWVQTAGVCSALNKSGTAVNLGLASSTTSGAMITVAATTTQIANALQAGVDGEYRAVYMNLE